MVKVAEYDVRIGRISMRGAIYVSSYDDDSLVRQEFDCVNYAREHGIEITKVYIDRGEQRGELELLLADAEMDAHTVVVVASLRRLASQPQAAADRVAEFAAIGVTVHQAREHDPNTADEDALEAAHRQWKSNAPGAIYVYGDDPAERARQEALCLDYALDNGITVTQVYADSGRYRSELAGLLYAATEGDVSTVLVASVQHLGPPQRAITWTISEFERVGVTVQAAREFERKLLAPDQAARLYRTIMDDWD